jgi:CelD/BcsL family acetyltransferase involved in cellulose biosynthesis
MTAATVASVAPATGAHINDKPTISSRPAGTRVELTTLAQLAGEERPQWNALFEAQRGVSNPFCAPEWVEAWYETFTSAEDRYCYTVRAGDQLKGVAPFFRSRVTAGRATVARRLQLVGAGQGGSLLELPQILTAPGQEREVLREIVTATLAADTGAHWVEASVTPAMAWFEPQWVKGTDRPFAFHRHQLSRASVIVPLDGAWLTTRSGLKRNVKESLRRSKNRIAKDGRPWAVHSHTDSLDREVVNRFLDLHRRRAVQDQSTSHHPDAFSDPARRTMMRAALPALGQQGRACILELELGGRIVAAQLVLHAPGLTYIHSSGFTSDVWDLGPVTFLQGEAISAAADRGERWINMSPGPNVAKLRWSETLDVHHDFAFGAGGRGLRWRYSAFAVAQAQSQASHAFEMGSDPG